MVSSIAITATDINDTTRVETMEPVVGGSSLLPLGTLNWWLLLSSIIMKLLVVVLLIVISEMTIDVPVIIALEKN